VTPVLAHVLGVTFYATSVRDPRCGKAACRLRRVTDGVGPNARDSPVMYARAIDDAGARLRELRHEGWQDLALAVLTLGLAVGAAELVPPLAIPLFSGGVFVGVLGIRALWRHWDLVDRLAGERDAYSIAEVLAYAAREATMERRRVFAALIRQHIEPADEGARTTLDDAAAELAALADELEDDALVLEPASAVACLRLVSEPTQSPLLDPALTREALRASAHRIRAGFTARDVAA